MDRPLVVVCVALLGGALAATGVSLALSPEPRAPVAQPDLGLAPLASRLETLAGEVSRLEARLRDMELRPAGSGREEVIRPLGAAGDLDELSQRLAALERGVGPMADERLVGDALLSHVSEAVDELREQEQAEREAEREVRREERRAELLAELIGTLGLDGWQAGQVQTLLDGAEERRDGLRDAFELTRDRDALRDGMQALGDELGDQSEAFLRPDQLEQLEQLGGWEALGGGGRGRGAFGAFGGGGGRGGGRGR